MVEWETHAFMACTVPGLHCCITNIQEAWLNDHKVSQLSHTYMEVDRYARLDMEITTLHWAISLLQKGLIEHLVIAWAPLLRQRLTIALSEARDVTKNQLKMELGSKAEKARRLEKNRKIRVMEDWIDGSLPWEGYCKDKDHADQMGYIPG